MSQEFRGASSRAMHGASGRRLDEDSLHHTTHQIRLHKWQPEALHYHHHYYYPKRRMYCGYTLQDSSMVYTEIEKEWVEDISVDASFDRPTPDLTP